MTNSRTPTGNRQLLLVEGSPFLARVIQKYLKSQGWEMTLASTPESALQHLNQTPFDRVVINLYPNSIQGMRILRDRPKTLNAKTPTCVLAGPSPSENEEARTLGALWVREFADFKSSDEFVRAVGI